MKPSSLFRTDASTAQLVTRLALGLVILPHGAQKLLGWFGGPGFAGTMGFLTQQAGLPAPLALVVVLAESAGALLLVLGLFTRLDALLVGAVMVGAIAKVHLANGFFMNWFGNQPGEGFEYHLLALGLVVPLVLRGGGRFALDALVARRLERDSEGGSTPLRRAA